MTLLVRLPETLDTKQLKQLFKQFNIQTNRCVLCCSCYPNFYHGLLDIKALKAAISPSAFSKGGVGLKIPTESTSGVKRAQKQTNSQACRFVKPISKIGTFIVHIL